MLMRVEENHFFDSFSCGFIALSGLGWQVRAFCLTLAINIFDSMAKEPRLVFQRLLDELRDCFFDGLEGRSMWRKKSAKSEVAAL
jgi:hypothetical protein